MLVAHDMDSRPQLTPWLAGVFVKPQCRGKGIGSALVRRIEAEARSLEVATLYLYTPNTESLYERLGWSVTERCEYRNTNVVVMSKELARVYDEAGNVLKRTSTRHNPKSRESGPLSFPLTFSWL
jgi:N-acetylglutamate synthase-like GNAT family acetyltransferase